MTTPRDKNDWKEDKDRGQSRDYYRRPSEDGDVWQRDKNDDTTMQAPEGWPDPPEEVDDQK